MHPMRATDSKASVQRRRHRPRGAEGCKVKAACHCRCCGKGITKVQGSDSRPAPDVIPESCVKLGAVIDRHKRMCLTCAPNVSKALQAERDNQVVIKTQKVWTRQVAANEVHCPPANGGRALPAPRMRALLVKGQPMHGPQP